MKLRLMAALVMALLAACGDSTTPAGDTSVGGRPTVSEGQTTTAPPPPPSTSLAPATTRPAGSVGECDGLNYPCRVGGLEFSEAPQRIVSASATHTEILYALGAGTQVAATDLFSDYPAEAVLTEKIDAFNINVEAVAAVDPDFVILAFDPGQVSEGLAALGIPTIVFDAPVGLDDVYEQFSILGAITGHRERADSVIADMSSRFEAVVAAVPTDAAPVTYYYELDPSYFSATSSTFVGSLFSEIGMVNIADPADDAGFGYPQLSAEYIVEQDPDYILLADTICCGASAETLADRPGWSTLTAVAGSGVIELDDAVASRWGPRLIDLVEYVAEAVHG